jgi:hypothetical protein
VLLQCVLNPSDPLHRLFCPVSPITNIPLKEAIQVGVLCRGGGLSSVVELERTVRVVGTTALLVL